MLVKLNPDPITTIPFLNAGRRRHQFFVDDLPIHAGSIDGLPPNIDCVIATADLQGREVLAQNPVQPPQLLGEVLPGLLTESLDSLGIAHSSRILVLLGGDFYTYEDLRGRGGTGDVRNVWSSFARAYDWVVGVAGNHDTFADGVRFNPPCWLLDGHQVEIQGLIISGLSGVIGDPRKNFRRSLQDYLDALDTLLASPTDILVLHDGPNIRKRGFKGSTDVREIIESRAPGLVVRGHAHWPQSLVEIDSRVQVLNVHARVAILTRAS